MDIHKLLQENKDELFMRLGSFLSDDEERSISEIAEAIKKGKSWFEENKQQLIELICSNYESLKNKSEINAAIEIAAIVGDSFTGVPALVIAVLVVKTGLKSFCKKSSIQFGSFFKIKRRKKDV